MRYASTLFFHRLDVSWPCRTSLSTYSDMITWADVHITTASSARLTAYVMQQVEGGASGPCTLQTRKTIYRADIPREKMSAMLLNK
jgi:hypothetical protein